MFGGRKQDSPVDRDALAAMVRLLRAIDDDLKRALANEMANRYDPVERVILAGFFVHACWLRFWKLPNRQPTLDALVPIVEEMAWAVCMRSPVPRDGPPPTRRDVCDAAELRFHTYESCFSLDMERAKHFPDLPIRLTEISEGAARFVFPELEDRERGARMLLARLHSYFRSTVWRIEHQDETGI